MQAAGPGYHALSSPDLPVHTEADISDGERVARRPGECESNDGFVQSE